MDPLWFALIAALAALLGVAIGYLLAKASAGGAAGSGLVWPDVICDPQTGMFARDMLRQIFNKAGGPEGPADPMLRMRVLNACMHCEFTHEVNTWHMPHDWNDPTLGACTRVRNAFALVIVSKTVTEADWIACADELEHNP